jgi:hypothetical protein
MKTGIEEAQQLIREGAPPELYRKLNDIFLDIGVCGTEHMVTVARELFKDVREVTGMPYYKGEGAALNRKLKDLSDMISVSCGGTCVIDQPRMTPEEIIGMWLGQL